MGLLLRLKEEPDISLEAECLTPAIGRMNPADAARLRLWQGSAQVEVGEFFAVERIETALEEELHIEGSLEKVKRIGQKTERGRLVVRGNCGMHTGEGMKGGEIEIHGDVGNWSFCLMQNGVVKIHGNAGAFLAAALPGDARGMKGGAIWVRKDAGARAAERMRRGLLVVGGTLGEFAGVEMIAGTIVSLGRAKARLGASMKRGSIIVMGEREPFLCGFEKASVFSPVFIPLLWRELASLGFVSRDSRFGAAPAKMTRWCGDLTSLGKGEILVHE